MMTSIDPPSQLEWADVSQFKYKNFFKAVRHRNWAINDCCVYPFKLDNYT